MRQKSTTRHAPPASGFLSWLDSILVGSGGGDGLTEEITTKILGGELKIE
jgi:hypothetical protein